MQSQSVILLAEVRHNELQAEAARLHIVNQASAHTAAPSVVVDSLWRRCWVTLANVAAGLHAHLQRQRVLATTRGNGSPAVSRLGADTL
jgi:hypothetical protein